LNVLLALYSNIEVGAVSRIIGTEGIGLLTPEVVHFGREVEVIAKRREVLRAAYQARPDRFVRKVPEPPPAPVAAWINAPKPQVKEENKFHESIQPEVLGVDGTREVVL